MVWLWLVGISVWFCFAERCSNRRRSLNGDRQHTCPRTGIGKCKGFCDLRPGPLKKGGFHLSTRSSKIREERVVSSGDPRYAWQGDLTCRASTRSENRNPHHRRNGRKARLLGQGLSPQGAQESHMPNETIEGAK